MRNWIRHLLRVFFALSILAGLFSLNALSLPHAHAASGKNLVLVGGSLQDTNAAVYNKIIDLAGGQNVAKIGIITAASIPPSQDPNAGTSSANNSQANGAFYANIFKSNYGAADAQWIPIDLDNISNNSSQQVVSQINSMTGFFIGGGDQSRLITCFYLSGRSDSPALAAIRTKFANGAVVSGSSAGTEVEGKPMLTGGESYEAARYGSSTSSPSSNNLTYDAQGGFNFFSYGIIDAHFSERGRQGRDIRLSWDTYTDRAYGVDENTALVVTNADTSSAQFQVVGPGGVTIMDTSAATRDYTQQYWSIYNVKVSYLTSGDTFDPNALKATISSSKTPMAGNETYGYAKSPSQDIFSSLNNLSSSGGRANPREFVNSATDLFNSYKSTSTYGLTYESGPTFEVNMTKSSSLGSAGYRGTLNGVTSYSYVNLKVDIFRY